MSVVARGRLPAVIVAVGLIMGVLTLARTSEDDIGAYGLIEALTPLYYAAVALVVGALIRLLRCEKPAVASLGFGVVSLVVLVDGAASVVESEPRFPVAWLHAAFTE